MSHATIAEDRAHPPEAAKYFGTRNEIHRHWVDVLRAELSDYSEVDRAAVIRDVYPPISPRIIERILEGDITVFEPGQRVFSRLASILGLIVEDHLTSRSQPEGKEREQWLAFIRRYPIRVAAGTGGGPGAQVPDQLDNLELYLLTRAIDELD
jgi:hypothetical protein